MARRRLGHVPDWLSIGELRLVLDVFYGAFDTDSAQATFVASPWDQRKYPPRVTVAELCAWLSDELERIRYASPVAEANTRQGLYGSDARQRRDVA